MNPMKLMKQLEEQQRRLESELDELRVSASAGGEMVVVTMNGRKDVQALKIDKQVINPDDAEMLQDLIVAALVECGRKVDAAMSDKMSGLASGLGVKLPGMR